MKSLKISWKFLWNLSKLVSKWKDATSISDTRWKNDITLNNWVTGILGKTIIIHGLSWERIACWIIK